MFAVGWGANQFSPMLIVYRHEQGLSAAAVAGLFAVYAATLIPGLLAGGPASDRFGRRAVVLPLVILSPAATALLIAGAHDLSLIIAGRALAGVCSGVVFGAASAWVRDLSRGSAVSARRAAFALTAGFGLGPVAAAFLAQWAPDPLVVPYLPHIGLGVAAIAVLWPARQAAEDAAGQTATGQTATGGQVTGGQVTAAGQAAAAGQAIGRERRMPAALRTWPFWISVAPAAPLVFGSISLAIVVLPEEVTSARTLSAGYAGLMTALAFAAGVVIQPLSRSLEERAAGAGSVAGLCCCAAGAAVAVPALAATRTPAGMAAAGLAAILLGAAYGLNLVSGLHQAENLAGPAERGAVLAAYYVLAYLGFGAPYLAAVLTTITSRTAAFAILAAAAAALAAWTAGSRAVLKRIPSRFERERAKALVPESLERP
jgi:MFS family permease